MRPSRPGRHRGNGPSGSGAGSRASASRYWRRKRLWRTARERESDRRCASTAQACVPTSIVEERPPVGGVAADHEADEYRVIAARHSAALLALDVCDDAVEHGDAAIVLVVAHASEPVRLVAGKTPRQRFLLGGENVEHEVGSTLERRMHVVHLLDRDEDERRIQRYRGDRARRHPDRLTLR